MKKEFSGIEAVRGGLLHDVGVQPQQAVVGWDRREDVGVQHGPHVVRHVVIHPLGINHPVALAEDDVPLHVELQGRGLVLLRPTREVGRFLASGGPDHQPIGRNVDRLEALEPVDHDVHARIDRRDPLPAIGIGEPLGLDGHVATGKDADPPRGRRAAPPAPGARTAPDV